VLCILYYGVHFLENILILGLIVCYASGRVRIKCYITLRVHTYIFINCYEINSDYVKPFLSYVASLALLCNVSR
jgi:hypothetical protein